MRSFFYRWFVVVCFFPLTANSAGKKQTTPPSFVGKKIIALTPINRITIEMPDHTLHNFGTDFQASLTTKLMQSGRYLLTDHVKEAATMEAPEVLSGDDYVWPGSVTPTSKIRIQVEALNFSTGSRGERMFYGFDEKFRTPFNDGSGTHTNEFPLKTVSAQPSWFENSFDQKGIAPFDSRAGLDLGDGFNINALFAWLSVKYASYHSELHLKLSLDTPLGAATQFRWIEVKGDGFFFDVAGAYENFSVGISVARRDAMDQALKNAIAGSFEAIDRALSEAPLMAKIDWVLNNGSILIGTGPFSEVKPGVLYEVVDNPNVIIEVSSSNASGSVGRVVHGDIAHAKAGLVLRQVDSVEPKQAELGALSGVPDAIESMQLPPIDFPSPDLDGLAPVVSKMQAFAKSLVEGIFLPYRIVRYFLYDQTYHAKADLGVSRPFKVSNEPWAKQIGLDKAPPMENVSPYVAVIDSGIDYNHPALHDAISFSPNGVSDPYGWDFISKDSRPYDDGYHGTQVASVVVSVAPHAKLLPVKIFNPWGITNSAAIYASFVYAVDHGAQIILCAWATQVSSQALEMGITYARDHGVVVVTAAGDHGLDLNSVSIYPAIYSRTLDNLITVTGVDTNNELVNMEGKRANYGSSAVQFAAPGKDIRVAEPRMRKTRASSTSLAAAIAAGIMARNLAANNLSGNYHDWIENLKVDSESVSGLGEGVQMGLRVHVRR